MTKVISQRSPRASPTRGPRLSVFRIVALVAAAAAAACRPSPTAPSGDSAGGTPLPAEGASHASPHLAPSGGAPRSTTAASASATPSGGAPLASEYRGTLDGHIKIVARLSRARARAREHEGEGERVTGYSFYEGIGGALALEGTLTGSHLTLDETANVGRTGAIEAELASDGSITGSWTGGPGKPSLALHLVAIPADAAPTSALVFKRTVRDRRPVAGAAGAGKTAAEVCSRDLEYAEVFGLPSEVEAKANRKLAPPDDLAGPHACDHAVEATARYRIAHNGHGILSVEVSGGVTDSQAAHPDAWAVPVTLWMATGEDVKLFGDILRPKDEPVVRRQLAASVAELAHSAGADADTERLVLDSFGEAPSFLVEKDGLRLCASTPHFAANLGGCQYALAKAHLPHLQSAAADLWAR